MLNSSNSFIRKLANCKKKENAICNYLRREKGRDTDVSVSKPQYNLPFETR